MEPWILRPQVCLNRNCIWNDSIGNRHINKYHRGGRGTEPHNVVQSYNNETFIFVSLGGLVIAVIWLLMQMRKNIYLKRMKSLINSLASLKQRLKTHEFDSNPITNILESGTKESDVSIIEHSFHYKFVAQIPDIQLIMSSLDAIGEDWKMRA